MLDGMPIMRASPSRKLHVVAQVVDLVIMVNIMSREIDV